MKVFFDGRKVNIPDGLITLDELIKIISHSFNVKVTLEYPFLKSQMQTEINQS